MLFYVSQSGSGALRPTLDKYSRWNLECQRSQAWCSFKNQPFRHLCTLHSSPGYIAYIETERCSETSMVDLEGEVNVRDTLVDRTGRQDIDICVAAISIINRHNLPMHKQSRA